MRSFWLTGTRFEACDDPATRVATKAGRLSCHQGGPPTRRGRRGRTVCWLPVFLAGGGEPIENRRRVAGWKATSDTASAWSATRTGTGGVRDGCPA